jgi:hypothetical protein
MAAPSTHPVWYIYRVDQNHIFIRIYDIWCTYGIFSREITICTVIYGVYIRFWPTLYRCEMGTHLQAQYWHSIESFATVMGRAVATPILAAVRAACPVRISCANICEMGTPLHARYW